MFPLHQAPGDVSLAICNLQLADFTARARVKSWGLGGAKCEVRRVVRIPNFEIQSLGMDLESGEFYSVPTVQFHHL